MSKKNLKKDERLEEAAVMVDSANTTEVNIVEVGAAVKVGDTVEVDNSDVVEAEDVPGVTAEDKVAMVAEIRKQVDGFIGRRAEIVPAGSAGWVSGWVKAIQVDMRPKTPCVLVVVEGGDKRLYRRAYSSSLLKVDMTSPVREAAPRVRVPETLGELEEALKKARVQLESARNKVALLERALEAAKTGA